MRAVVDATGVLKGKARRALDSTLLDDAVATQDTVTQARFVSCMELPGHFLVSHLWEAPSARSMTRQPSRQAFPRPGTAGSQACTPHLATISRVKDDYITNARLAVAA